MRRLFSSAVLRQHLYKAPTRVTRPVTTVARVSVATAGISIILIGLKCETACEQIKQAKDSGHGEAKTDAEEGHESQMPPAFATWLKSRGANWNNIFVKDGDDSVQGSTVHTSSPITANSELARVPKSLLMTDELARRSPITSKCFKELLESGNKLNAQDSVVVFLSLAKNEPAFAPYVNYLPTKFHTPLHFTRKQLACLEGTALGHAAKDQMKGLKKKWASMSAGSPEFKKRVDMDTYLWADSVYWSRALGIPDLNQATVVQDSRTDSLVPLVDFCNHSERPTANWDVADDGGLVLLASETGLASGEEVTISYGDKSNEELLWL